MITKYRLQYTLQTNNTINKHQKPHHSCWSQHKETVLLPRKTENMFPANLKLPKLIWNLLNRKHIVAGICSIRKQRKWSQKYIPSSYVANMRIRELKYYFTSHMRRLCSHISRLSSDSWGGWVCLSHYNRWQGWQWHLFLFLWRFTEIENCATIYFVMLMRKRTARKAAKVCQIINLLHRLKNRRRQNRNSRWIE